MRLFFQDEIPTPLSLDVYIRIPEQFPNSRFATLAPPPFVEMVKGFPPRLALVAISHRSNIYRALNMNPGFAVVLDQDRVYSRNLEVPSGGAVGTARAIARAYGVFATGGQELGMQRQTPSRAWKFGSPRSFGSPGSGGSLGFADPEAGALLGSGCVRGDTCVAVGVQAGQPGQPNGNQAAHPMRRSWQESGNSRRETEGVTMAIAPSTPKPDKPKPPDEQDREIDEIPDTPPDEPPPTPIKDPPPDAEPQPPFVV